MKWLQSLAAICIDPKRCPDTAREFGEYEYEVGKDGQVLPGYPDADNHHIDAVRYATNRLWTRRRDLTPWMLCRCTALRWRKASMTAATMRTA